ncbi:MAG TPA: hypothetical protein VGP77_07265 [Vicinamibacterales bacterium]|nr:hypothetical protein [Vicinamibacterales bacterium]
MKRLALALFVSAAAVSVSLSAQTTPSSSSAQKITVTGCVQRATSDSPTGTSGVAGAAIPDTQFVLSNASAGTATAATSGATSPLSSAMATAPRYRLDDAEQAKIAPHVGHKVEVTGTIDPTSPSATAGATSTAAPAPKLKVDSVKMLASTCSE